MTPFLQDDFEVPSQPIFTSKLNNSEYLNCLSVCKQTVNLLTYLVHGDPGSLVSAGPFSIITSVAIMLCLKPIKSTRNHLCWISYLRLLTHHLVCLINYCKLIFLASIQCLHM